MNIQQALAAVLEKQNLSVDEMTDVMRQIMGGEATPAQIGGFLVGLRMKGESVDEIQAAARVMRDMATPVKANPAYLVDTCGTGGDASGTFNISTASAFVAAAGGVNVAKHGNRSVSSQSGSADVLEKAGVNLSLSAEQVSACIEQEGIGFMFAPNHHGVMKHAIGPRREMKVRTLFNLLGPLTNPAAAPNQVMGVFSREWLEPMAKVLKALGSRHVMVVNAEDGLDEISICSPTHCVELKEGQIINRQIRSHDFGLQVVDMQRIQVASSDESYAMIQRALNNETGAPRDIVALNAGAALYVAGKADSLADGVNLALETIASGAAMKKLEAYARLTQTFAEK